MTTKEKKQKLFKKKLKANFSAIITFISAIYKLVTGFFLGLVFMASGAYTFVIFLCKLLYAKNIESDKQKQIYTYFKMSLLLIIVSVFFLISNIVTINDIPKDYGLSINILLASIILVLFILSLFGMKKKRSNENILTRGIKLTAFTSSLINLVLFEKLFIYYFDYYHLINDIYHFNLYFVIIISSIIVLISVLMFINFLIINHKYNKEK